MTWAAARLGVVPARSVIVDDAIAGVEAGKRGGFGLLIGIDRGHTADALKTQASLCAMWPNSGTSPVSHLEGI
jgi:beta-phosphoglucomutase-like phosphatase (HAD superfamily)